jgi:hypothetical protein
VKWTISGEGPFSRSPAPRDVTGDNANDHGSWDATQFYGSRSFALTGKAYAPDHDVLHTAEQRFMTAVGLGLLVRHVEPGFDRQARFRRAGEVLWTEITDTIAQFSASLWAGDPRWYSHSMVTAETPFPSSSGGLTWPATWPATWAATIATGLLRLTNLGNETAWPLYIITGPVTEPSIVNADTGQAMNFDIALAAGESLHVNTATHQVLANGEQAASRRSTFHGDWFGLRPGANNIRFNGSSGRAGARLSVTYQHTGI